MAHFFPPNSSGNLRSDAHQSQIIGGDADVDHTQIIGGYTVNLLGVYIPHLPRVLSPLSRALSSPPPSPFKVNLLSYGVEILVSCNKFGFCFVKF